MAFQYRRHFDTAVLTRKTRFSVKEILFALFQCILSLLMLCISDVNVLITYTSFVESFFITMSVGGVLWLRYKRPEMERPIKVSSRTNIGKS